jgi:predicted homoserine dehydrogenase-like protein
VVVPDGGLLAELPLDVVVEATGDPEVGAANAVAAIDAGKHLVMVTKEADSVIGPLLARRAAAAGRIVTPVDGDQPSLTIGLKSWAELLGLKVVAAGKASEYDFVWDPRAQPSRRRTAVSRCRASSRCGRSTTAIRWACSPSAARCWRRCRSGRCRITPSCA